MTSSRTTIYESIGGADAVAAAVDRFYERVLADPALVGYFDGLDMARLKGHQRSFIAAAIGGPELYEGRPMKEAHARFRIRPAHFDLVVGHLVATLTELGVPAETIGTIGETLGPLKADIAPPENTLAG
ncbi:group I truncated hemoglobin [Pseudonocardia sp. RS010]|uniref:group I truncated hemoglobin n=1 Tax=Pseudonocardia sp. RS010 TaxID=3385979 RepID=UPI0039A2BF6D